VKILIFTQNHQLPLIGGSPQSSVFQLCCCCFIYRWRIPEGSHVSKRGGLKAASNLLHFSIETVDANHDGSTDSVVHFDASNGVTLLGVANLTAHDFLFL